MKCNNCGFEYPDNNEYCSNCGSPNHMAQQNAATNYSPNPAVQTITSVLRDNLFLVLCILASAVSVSSILMGSLNVLYILYTIFLWLVFFNVKKEPADSKLLRNLSGTVFATFIIEVVVISILLLAGVLIVSVINSIQSDSQTLNQILSYIGEFEPQHIEQMQYILNNTGYIFFIILILACALALLLVILSYKKIHNFAKSVADSVQCGVLNLKSMSATKVWLIIFAISGAADLRNCTSAMSFINVISVIACNIIAFCLVAKLDQLSKNQPFMGTQNM